MENIIFACMILSIVLIGAFIEYLFYKMPFLRIFFPLVTVIGLVVCSIYGEKLLDSGHDSVLIFGLTALGFGLLGMFMGWLLGYAKYNLTHSKK